jgi:hypothetical protein
MAGKLRVRLSGLILSCVVALAGNARAGGVDPTYVPPDAKWVVHVNVDALVKSNLWSMINTQFQLLPDPQRSAAGSPSGAGQLKSDKIKAVSDALGMRLPDDLHGLTLVGRSFDPEEAVLIVKANVDRDRVIGMAKLNPQYHSTLYKNVEVGDVEGLSWAFLADGVVVLGQRVEQIEGAIDAVQRAKNGAATTPSGLLTNSALSENAPVMVCAAVQDLQALQQQKDLSPILAPVTNVYASIAERQEDLVLNVVLYIKTDEAARQVRGALEGVRALGILAASNKQDSPLKTMTELAQRSTVTVDRQTVTVEWPVALSAVQPLIDHALHKTRQPTAPATQPSSR